MKNQYFGDISDYRKYGLLRSIYRVANLKTLVAWMLTKDDGSTDGQKLSYLSNDKKWSGHDPELFETLKHLITQNPDRAVALIEQSPLLSNTEFFSRLVPDDAMGRGSWFNQLLKHTSQCDLVFLDPDNGLEVKSKPYGRSKSSKYIYKREVKQLWQSGKSLLIYQHFIPEKREVFIERMLRGLAELTEDASITAFTTSHVVFFMILQPKHTHLEDAIVSEVNQSWSGQVGLYHPNNL